MTIPVILLPPPQKKDTNTTKNYWKIFKQTTRLNSALGISMKKLTTSF